MINSGISKQEMEQVCMVLRTFRSDCEQRGPLNEHPVVDVRARRTLLSTENADTVGNLVQSQENQP